MYLRWIDKLGVWIRMFSTMMLRGRNMSLMMNERLLPLRDQSYRVIPRSSVHLAERTLLGRSRLFARIFDIACRLLLLIRRIE